MRKTRLKRTSTALVVLLAAVAVLFALLRSYVLHPSEALAQSGAALFETKGCIQCHYTDSRKTRVGPGLKGLFDRETLPVSGRKATEENVRKQLKTPFQDMPSFADRLTEEQMDRLVDYLKTL